MFNWGFWEAKTDLPPRTWGRHEVDHRPHPEMGWKKVAGSKQASQPTRTARGWNNPNPRVSSNLNTMNLTPPQAHNSLVKNDNGKKKYYNHFKRTVMPQTKYTNTEPFTLSPLCLWMLHCLKKWLQYQVLSKCSSSKVESNKIFF